MSKKQKDEFDTLTRAQAIEEARYWHNKWAQLADALMDDDEVEIDLSDLDSDDECDAA